MNQQKTSSTCTAGAAMGENNHFVPQWKKDLIQRRKITTSAVTVQPTSPSQPSPTSSSSSSICPKTIGANQPVPVTHLLKHNHGTCIGIDEVVIVDDGGKITGSTTSICDSVVAPIHTHNEEQQEQQQYGKEKPFQLNFHNEYDKNSLLLSPPQSPSKLFLKQKKTCSAGGGKKINENLNNSNCTKQKLKQNPKMVAVHEINETITKEIDSFDPSEELQYGPGIVSKLRCRYLTLTLRQTSSKQRLPLDNLRRATSLNNLLDNDVDDDEDEDDDDVDDDDEEEDDGEEEYLNNNKKTVNKSVIVVENKKNTMKSNEIVACLQAISATNTEVNKKIQFKSDHHHQYQYQQQPQIHLRSARQIKRGNDSLKRARSVEALLCDKLPWSGNNNNTTSIITTTTTPMTDITIEDKIYNARERNLLNIDKIPKRLTSIIDDTERPPPDVVKETLKKFEAKTNRCGGRGPRRNPNGDVATKIANYKSIISQDKPLIIYPKPMSPKKNQNQQQPSLIHPNSPISEIAKKFTASLDEQNCSTPNLLSYSRNNSMEFTANASAAAAVVAASNVAATAANGTPDIIPRKHNIDKTTATTTPMITKKFKAAISNYDSSSGSGSSSRESPISQQQTTQTINNNSFEYNSESDLLDGIEHHNSTNSSSAIVQVASKRVSKSALDNISKAGTTQHYSFNKQEIQKQPAPKQVGVIRPLLATNTKTPLTSREIEKNMINDKKNEEASLKESSNDTSGGEDNNSDEGGSGGKNSPPMWLNSINKKKSSTAKTKNNGNHLENNTMVFNFKDRKEVPDYIENDGLMFRKRRELPKPNESGFVLLSDTSLDTSTDTDDIWQQMGPPSPCDVEFINANIIIDGKSSIRNRSTRELHYRVQFNDSLTSTFEYPSESSILDVTDFSHNNSDAIENDEDNQFSNTTKMLGNLSLERKIVPWDSETANQTSISRKKRPNVLKKPQYAKFLQNDIEGKTYFATALK